jgi:RNA polymerase sigma factor (sigma-70 family)
MKPEPAIKMINKDDRYYIERVLSGETDAFSVLVDKYKTLAYNISLRIVKRPEDAEEVTQDAFVKAYRSLGGFKGDSRFSTWLYRIVYNSSITLMRKRQHEIQADREMEWNKISSIADDDGSNQDELIAGALKKSLASLPADEQLIITLYYYDNSSIEDIAKIMAISVSNVKIRLFRTRKKLYESIRLNMNDRVPVI